MLSTAGLAAVWVCVLGGQALGETNVYGDPMKDCGSSHATGCTYSSYDSGAHQVCVTQLPAGFSSNTGQGPWSDEFTGQPWCICIWAYSNYILQKKDLSLRCESIPAKVLEARYSLDKFKQCGSMSSTQGCGAEDIRRSIQSLCDQCAAQAPGEAGKASLKSKCDAILASAPAAAMQRLYSTGTSEDTISQEGGAVAHISLVAIVGVSLAMVLEVARRRRNSDDQSAVTGDAEAAEDYDDVFDRKALVE